MKTTKAKKLTFNKQQLTPGRLSVVFTVLAVIGVVAIVASHADTAVINSEAELGTVGGNAKSIASGVTGASGGGIVTFSAAGGGGGGGGGGTTDPERTDWNCGGSYSGEVGGTIQPQPTTGKVVNASGDPSSAISSASAGDIVLIAPGTYGALNISKSGSANNCITIMGNGGIATFSSVKVSGSYVRVINVSSKGSSSYGWELNGTNHVTLANVKVEGSKNGGINFPGASFVLIDGCDVARTNGGPGNGGEGEAISVADGTTDSEVRYCKVHDSGEEGIDVKYSNNKITNVKVHHNEVYGNGGPNIYIDGVNGVKVYNNTVYGATKSSKSGIMLGCESEWAPSSPSQNIEIYNNTVHDNAAAGISVYDGGCGITNINVHDNILSGGDDLDLGGATNVTKKGNTVDGKAVD